jgi:hypothetical protein
VGLDQGPLSLVRIIEELLERKYLCIALQMCKQWPVLGSIEDNRKRDCKISCVPDDDCNWSKHSVHAKASCVCTTIVWTEKK